MTRETFLYRMWYYFRLGYGTYVTFPFGLLSFIATVYYLLIKNIPVLSELFPSVIVFSLLIAVIGGPVSIGFGWWHMKRSRIYSTEQDIGYEANPYVYKIPEGFMKEAVFPFYKETLSVLRAMAQQSNMPPVQLRKLEELETKMQTLIEGGSLGHPKGHGATEHLKR